jgi:hypothetical protein
VFKLAVFNAERSERGVLAELKGESGNVCSTEKHYTRYRL